MTTPQPQWQIVPVPEVPQWFIDAVKSYIPNSEKNYGAQLLWQRGIRDLDELAGYIDPELYHSIEPWAFGEEMHSAIDRLQKARKNREKVTIWGDFDADGITSTSVLWDGLGQFFPQYLQLDYYIPNRLRESHGLNNAGIERLAVSGTKLIVTCDTGSTNLTEINYARELGIDLIITDHHTLPESRPPVTAIINPRYLATTHPLYNLSGVAVAYKLVEALYQALPDIPQQPIEHLLDLVAIGLIADLVELKGDCRYLSQIGIKQLQKQVNPATTTRPGVARLLELCRRNGDRPTDISFGLGPRINAVSRIHGDASFCVELLTSKDAKRCDRLALETELANTRRKSLQKDTLERVKQKLARLDLSTTSVIVLEDPQWQGGVLGLVAGQIAQEYGLPTILLTGGIETEQKSESEVILAKGSARSINKIDLYGLVKSQSHLLHRFGGHPFAAGLSLPLANLELFREGINQQLRSLQLGTALMPSITADSIVTVADLGKDLFDHLRLLEPYGMGNPVPKLLIKNCWFKNVWHNNIQDSKGNKIQYIKTTFNLWDDSVKNGFSGMWWGHYKDEIPQDGKCDAIVELDFNTYQKRYEVRLLAVRSQVENLAIEPTTISDSIIDRRDVDVESNEFKSARFIIVDRCPLTWSELQKKYHQAQTQNNRIVLAYSAPKTIDPQFVWEQLIGIVKYLVRKQQSVSKLKLQDKLNLSDRSFALGLQALEKIGFGWSSDEDLYQFTWQPDDLDSNIDRAINLFKVAIKEEQFQRQYFERVPLSTIDHQLTAIDVRSI
jgi:single-stranded-DNA-specific exonuclease